MKSLRIIPILLVLCTTVHILIAQSKHPEISKKLDQYLTETMELHKIPGLALAVIEEGNVLYKGYFGLASLQDSSSVNEKTLFRVFSTTKIITSTGIFQLIQRGKLDLDDRISEYLHGLPKHWQDIRVKHLLTHSSGIPDMIRYESTLSDQALMDSLSSDSMDFETGDQFRYNQTNYWLLAKIIEKLSGKTFQSFILENQFDSADNEVLFSSNATDNIPDRATRYYYDNKSKSFVEDTNDSGERGHAGNGLNINLDQFISWSNKIDNYEILDQKNLSQMWTPFAYANGKEDFLHGWGSYFVNHITSYGFSGGNLAAFRKLPEQKTTIILLSNGYEIPAYDIIVNDVARIALDDLRNTTVSLEEDVMASVIHRHFDLAKTTFDELRKENPHFDFDNLRWNVNSLGNKLVSDGKIKEALSVFSFNAISHPDWWVSLAALAETQELLNNNIEATENYRKAIALNKNNQWNYNETMQERIKMLSNK